MTQVVMKIGITQGFATRTTIAHTQFLVCHFEI